MKAIPLDSNLPGAPLPPRTNVGRRDYRIQQVSGSDTHFRSPKAHHAQSLKYAVVQISSTGNARRDRSRLGTPGV